MCWVSQFRSSHKRCSMKKGVPRNFPKFIGKHLCQSLFFNKVASLRPATLLKKRDSGTGVFLCFLENFWEHLFYRAPPEECFCQFTRSFSSFYKHAESHYRHYLHNTLALEAIAVIERFPAKGCSENLKKEFKLKMLANFL